MVRFKSCLALLLALFWVPLLAHCELAGALGLEIGHSADCSGAHETTPESGCDHCRLCQEMAEGVTLTVGPHLELKPVLMPVPDFLLPLALPARPELDQIAASPPPPDRPPPASWQFAQRTALLPRAPSGRA